jgi:hypothetical protein
MILVASHVTGCVATDLGAPVVQPLCIAPSTTTATNASVALVDADLQQAGVLECSAVVISPSLVLTNLLCVTLPSALEPSDVEIPNQRPLLSGTELWSAAVDYGTNCPAGAGWAAHEDGSFSAQLGPLVDPSSLTVFLSSNDEQIAKSSVRRVLVSHANSRCWDSLAVLVLDEPLGIPSLPVRLDESSHVGEAVTLSGSGRGSVRPYQVSTTIEEVTFEAGDESAPPRSLFVDEQICDFESGGALASAQSGALIGIIAFGTGDYCGDPAGGSIVTRLAPFARMLAEAADSVSELLQIEAPSDPRLLRALPPCAPQ